MRLPYEQKDYEVNREAFQEVLADLKRGVPLNLTMIGAIFGTPFWQLLILTQSDIKVNTNGDMFVNIYTGTNRPDS